MSTSRLLRRALILAAAGPLSTVSLFAQTAPAPDPNAQALEKIEVSAQRAHYRGDVAIEDIPQSVQVITGETLKLVGAVKLNDALDLAAGVARQNVHGAGIRRPGRLGRAGWNAA